MAQQRIYLTEKKVYTPEEVVDYFSGKISDKNMEVLVAHLCMEDLSHQVESVTEQNGVLFLNIGEGFFSIDYSEKHPKYGKKK